MKTDCIVLFGPRACGKSTVGKTLLETLPEWRFVDIDYEFRLRFKPVFTRINSSQDASYYGGCREILLEQLEAKKVIIALNGGSLINGVAPAIGAQNLTNCRRRGKLVLILPSRFHFRNRKILLKRESEREYHLPEDHVEKTYNSRIKYLREYADFIAIGGTPDSLAKRIINRYELLR